jgi:TRAP-type C4-dicarboxylate transport system permease small subunit
VGPDRLRVAAGRVLVLIDRALAVAACVLLAVLMGMVLLGVITRGMDAPLTWTDEGARFTMAWLACCGWMLAGRRRAHVRIRFFVGLLPRPAWCTVEVTTRLAMAGLGAGVAWFGVVLVVRNAGLEATSLPLSMAWLYVPLVPAGIAMTLQSLGEVALGQIVGERGEAAP